MIRSSIEQPALRCTGILLSWRIGFRNEADLQIPKACDRLQTGAAAWRPHEMILDSVLYFASSQLGSRLARPKQHFGVSKLHGIWQGWLTLRLLGPSARSTFCNRLHNYPEHRGITAYRRAKYSARATLITRGWADLPVGL